MVFVDNRLVGIEHGNYERSRDLLPLRKDRIYSMTNQSNGDDVKQAPTKNEHLIRWVEKMADLTQPAAIHWVDGTQEEYDGLCREMVASGTFIQTESRTVAGLLLRAVRPERCGSRGRANLHLLAIQGQRRPHEQLGRPVCDARAS